MSLFSAFMKGWSFRTSTPTFEPGSEITAFITGRTDGSYVARIGDTILRVEEDNGAASNSATTNDDRSAGGGETDLVDTRVRLRVEAFDADDHTGRATVLERLDSGGF